MTRKQFDWKLPEEIKVRLGEESYGRQRTIFEKDHLLIILNSPPEPDENERESIVFLRYPDGRFFCNGAENGVMMLRKLLKSYFKIYEKYEKMYEKATTSDELYEILEHIIPVHRSCTNFYNTIQSARKLIDNDIFLISVRDEMYDLQRGLELLLSSTKMAMEYKVAKNAELQVLKSKEAVIAQHKLNILAAVTFPLMAITAPFGMSLSHGLEGYAPYAFWGILAVSLVIGFALKTNITKEKISSDL